MGGDEARAAVRTIGLIPVHNIWLLMFYGSGQFLEYERVRTGREALPDDVPDLVAEVLLRAVEERFRRHLSTGYRSRHADLTRVRGCIDLLTTERRQLLLKGRVACRFDELTIDTVRNRMVLSAFDKLCALVRSSDLAARCRSMALRFIGLGVSPLRLSRAEMSAERAHRHDPVDGAMLAAARLVLDMALLTEEGDTYLPAPDRADRWVRRLFEKAVGGFYRFVLDRSEWGVKCGVRLDWQIDKKTGGIEGLLPGMVTDLMLCHQSTSRRIVIDTKFTNIITANAHARECFKSGHIYQIYAYLRSQAGRGDSADRADGMLLHPSIDKNVDEIVVIQGHAIRFATVNLAGSAASIRDRLLQLVEPWGQVARRSGGWGVCWPTHR